MELGGRRVRVGWAQKNTSLCVSGLEPGITIQMLVAEFGRYGPLDKELTTIKPEGETEFCLMISIIPSITGRARPGLVNLTATICRHSSPCLRFFRFGAILLRCSSGLSCFVGKFLLIVRLFGGGIDSFDQRMIRV